MKKPQKLWSGLFFLLLGTSIIAYGVYITLKQFAFLENANEVKGTVIEVIYHDDSYYPSIEFVDNRGEKIQFVANYGCAPACYEVSDEVSIVYDPNDSMNAKINGYVPLWMTSWIAFLVGLVQLAFFTRTYFKYWRNASNAQQEDLESSVSATRSDKETELAFEAKNKPIYLQLTDRWTIKLTFVWCILSLFLGLVFVETMVAIAIPLMTAFMSFNGYWGMRLMLYVQKFNRDELKQRYYDWAVIFFWGGGVCFFPLALINGLTQLFQSDDLTHGYFFISASVFPLGCSLGASKQWQQRFIYRE